MSPSAENSQELHELAQSPAEDPRRCELEDRLTMMTPATRTYWTEELRLTDQLYALLGEIRMDGDLERRLLDIPNRTKPTIWRRLMNQPAGWGHWAAAIAALSLLTGALIWSMQPPPLIQAPRLNVQVANAIAAMATSHHAAPVQFAGSNPAEIQNAMERLNLPFSPVVLHPSSVLTLCGGGVFKYRSTSVAFTRWTGGGINYTLYQFDGVKLGAPPIFASVTESPANTSGYRVEEWSGADGQCAWALVLESGKATDVFSAGCR